MLSAIGGRDMGEFAR